MSAISLSFQEEVISISSMLLPHFISHFLPYAITICLYLLCLESLLYHGAHPCNANTQNRASQKQKKKKDLYDSHAQVASSESILICY